MASTIAPGGGPPPSPAHALQQQKCQVKVMRLALTRLDSSAVLTSSSSRASMLQLPKIFEAIHAGQEIKCLARISFAPPNARAVARMFPPADSKAPAFDLGQAINTNISSSLDSSFDLIMQGRLQHAGVHELVLTCGTREQGEVLRKVFRIEVQPSLHYSSAPQQFVLPPISEGGASALVLLLRFQVKNYAKSLVAAVSRAEFVPEDGGVQVVKEYWTTSFVGPQESVAIMFRLRVMASSTPTLGRLVIAFGGGLGEHCQLTFPPVQLRVSLLLNASAAPTRMAVVGQPLQQQQQASSLVEPGCFLVHGSTVDTSAVTIIPTRPGLFSNNNNTWATLGEKFDLSPPHKQQQQQLAAHLSFLSDD